MSNDVHTISVADASDPLAQPDRLIMVLKKAVAYPAGAGAGAASVVNVTGLRLPLNYAVFSGASGAYVDISAQTNTGFTMTVTPRSGTLAAGSASLLILA